MSEKMQEVRERLIGRTIEEVGFVDENNQSMGIEFLLLDNGASINFFPSTEPDDARVWVCLYDEGRRNEEVNGDDG